MGFRFVLPVAFLLGAGCQLIFKLRADKIVLLTWLEAPEVNIPNVMQMPRAVTATAIFLDRKGGVDPVPVSGGFAGFFGAGKLFPMAERDPAASPGVYVVTSLDDRAEGEPALPYDTDENRRYGFKACTVNRGEGCIGEEFSINRILAAPALDASTIVFEPALQPSSFDGFAGTLLAGTALKVKFPTPTDDNRYRPVVTVMAASADPTQAPGLVFNSVPTGGAELVAYLTTEPPLEIDIPADKLSAAGVYVIMTGSARLNLDTSDNLFIGSGAIAGSMNAFLIEVHTQ